MKGKSLCQENKCQKFGNARKNYLYNLNTCIIIIVIINCHIIKAVISDVKEDGYVYSAQHDGGVSQPFPERK